MAEKFQDDIMSWEENDIDKIKLKTGMYISYVGEKGALHLCKEVIQNAIDECANKKSPAKNIHIILDLDTDTISVEDDGRGIPEDNFPLDILCTKLNSGSKFTREQGGASSGENGVGNTAVNALSDIFKWASFRDGTEHRIEFEEGIKVNDVTRKSKKEHGCIVTFKPSKKYLGKSTKIPKKGLISWVENISYFIPDKCKIVLDIYKGMKLEESYKYKAKDIKELLKANVTDDTISTMHVFSGKKKLVEDFRGERNIDRELFLEFAFVYSDTVEPWIDSYCNYVNTTSGGVHLAGVQESIWRFLMKKTLDAMSDKEKEKYKILKVDIEQGLNLVVNIFTDMQMQFVGQTKNEVSSENLVEPIKALATKELNDYFNENKEKLNQLVKIVKSNCKARIDASKLKAATVKENINKFDKHTIDKFTPCNNEGKAYKELHICEGDSAKGSLVDGRDPDTQAFFAIKGVVANGFKRNEATILDNKEWYDYVKLLKTNFGPKFDLSKCYYDKIIIETDSDIDGFGISSGIGAFHALYMPELVKDGRLYKAIAPLYHIDDKKTPYVRDKREYVGIYQDKIIQNYSVTLSNSKLPMDKKDFKEFIYDTQEYSDELIRLSKHFGVNKFLIERVAAYMTMHDVEDIEKFFENNKKVLDLIDTIQKKFPEITLKGNNNLRGVVDGKFQSIAINRRFMQKIEDVQSIYRKYGYALLVVDKDGGKRTMSIGEFLDVANKFKPRIITRYKGLTLSPCKTLLIAGNSREVISTIV